MRILVTGGAGFIGSPYVRTLLTGGYPGFGDASVTATWPISGSPQIEFVQGESARSWILNVGGLPSMSSATSVPSPAGLSTSPGRSSSRPLVLSGAESGIYHATSSGMTTWFGLAREVFGLLGADPAGVKATTSEAYPRPTSRPSYSVLGMDGWAKVGLEPIGN